MRIALDATPLLGQVTGVGTYTRGLLSGLVDLGAAPRLVPFTLRSGGRPAHLPSAATWRHVPAPARLLQGSWARTQLPPVELFTGRIDVFHATNFVLPPSWRAASVVTVHDLTYLRHPEWVTPAVLRYRELVPRSLRRPGTIVITPSAAVAKDVATAYGLPDHRVVVTPLGVDPDWGIVKTPEPSWFTVRALPTDYVLFVGTREPRKNLQMLLQAHRAAYARGAPPLVLAGPAGWGKGTDMHEGVHATGWLPRSELQSLVAGAQALLTPSHYEGFGLPILEAMAAGTPVIASDIPTHRETAGGHAVLLPPDDVSAWASQLASLETLSTARRVAAAAWASNHTWVTCASETIVAYQRARR